MPRLISLCLLAAISMLQALCAGVVESDSVSTTPPIIASINQGGRIEVQQPEALAHRLLPGTSENEQASEEDEGQGRVSRQGRTGYRVEVFADNNVRTAKVKAAATKRVLQQKFPGNPVYLVFDAPFWRVRMGDYTSRAAAESAMADARRSLPHLSSDIRIVRCQIN